MASVPGCLERHCLDAWGPARVANEVRSNFLKNSSGFSPRSRRRASSALWGGSHGPREREPGQELCLLTGECPPPPPQHASASGLRQALGGKVKWARCQDVLSTQFGEQLDASVDLRGAAKALHLWKGQRFRNLPSASPPPIPSAPLRVQGPFLPAGV